eukprot:1187009-Prorocentrum_minimum.AAC.1
MHTTRHVLASGVRREARGESKGSRDDSRGVLWATGCGVCVCTHLEQATRCLKLCPAFQKMPDFSADSAVLSVGPYDQAVRVLDNGRANHRRLQHTLVVLQPPVARTSRNHKRMQPAAGVKYYEHDARSRGSDVGDGSSFPVQQSTSELKVKITFGITTVM